MRVLFLSITALAFSITATCQSKKILALFEKAEKQCDDSLLQEALLTYKTIQKKVNGSSDMYAKATYNVAYLYYCLQKTDSAVLVFEEILNSDFDEMDGGGPGSGIMADPYALYKHRACKYLAWINLRKENYKSALEYLELCSSKYPYQHFCGNEIASNDIYMATIFARTYCGLKDTNMAIKKMLPYIFDNDLADNTTLVDSTISLLKTKYSPDFLKDAINKAISNAYIKKFGRNRQYQAYFIKFLNTEIQIIDYGFGVPVPGQSTEMDRRISKVKQSRFYQSLQRL